tara:strand:+ start:508 stop:1107 length:600 start_codon:yes stop_codon:yes gene_type:complete
MINNNTTQIDKLQEELVYTTPTTVTAKEITELANKLLGVTWLINRNGLYKKEINLKDLGWSFEFNNRKKSLGLCSSRSKTIFLSKWLFNQNLDKGVKFEDTIRHEIAHAIDYSIRRTSDHSKIWVMIALEVLCNGERCYSSNDIKVTKTTKYTLICDSCKEESPSHKKKKRRSACGDCCRKHNFGRFSIKYVLRQVQNY